jgi:Zn-dependent peptidase ImmA (M78 family)
MNSTQVKRREKIMNIEIKGKTEHCSKEFIRSWAYATGVVAALHNMDTFDITIKFVSPTHNTLERFGPQVRGGHKYYAGLCSRPDRLIYIQNNESPERTVQIMLHELIHMWIGPFPDVEKEDGTKVATEEKITSTLTAKLLPEVKPIAEKLCEGYYRRAAYLAHAKISYINKEDEDWYDQAQWKKIGVRDGRKKIPNLLGNIFKEGPSQ